MLMTLRNSLIDPGVEGGLNRRQLEIFSALRSFHCKVKSALHTGLKPQVSYQFFKRARLWLGLWTKIFLLILISWTSRVRVIPALCLQSSIIFDKVPLFPISFRKCSKQETEKTTKREIPPPFPIFCVSFLNSDRSFFKIRARAISSFLKLFSEPTKNRI